MVERYGISNVFDILEAALAKCPNVAVIATPAPSHVPRSVVINK